MRGHAGGLTFLSQLEAGAFSASGLSVLSPGEHTEVDLFGFPLIWVRDYSIGKGDLIQFIDIF